MRVCAFTGNQHRDVIVFKNLRFHASRRVQQNGVFKNLHSGERFWKDAFSVIVFTGYEWTVGQTGEKKSVFKKKTDACGRDRSITK